MVSVVRCFFEWTFAHNNSILLLQSFLACFDQIYYVASDSNLRNIATSIFEAFSNKSLSQRMLRLIDKRIEGYANKVINLCKEKIIALDRKQQRYYDGHECVTCLKHSKKDRAHLIWNIPKVCLLKRSSLSRSHRFSIRSFSVFVICV